MRPEAFEVAVPDAVAADLRERLERTRWPDQPRGAGWEFGVDVGYLRDLCRHWADGYDFARLPGRMNAHPNIRWNGMHAIRAEAGGDGLPVLLVHGWPTGPPLYLDLIPPLAEEGHDVVVPSLPGFGWSDDPGAALNIAAVAARVAALMEGLGYGDYVVAGGDWGAPIAARIASDQPGRVVGLYVYTPGTLPTPPDLAEPPLSEAEQAFVEEATRWRRQDGHHLYLQGAAPDIVAVGLGDSPAGLAAYLVEKYRRWSDSGGDVESRIPRDVICDLLTMYWATGTIASSMRLYLGERRDRWRLRPGETVGVPAGVARFPGDLVRPPREWSARVLSDLRRFNEMPSGGHFAPIEEPDLLADDLLGFLGEID